MFLWTFPFWFRYSRKIDFRACLYLRISLWILNGFYWSPRHNKSSDFDYALNIWTFRNLPVSLLRCVLWLNGDSMEFNRQLKRKNPTMTSFVGISFPFLCLPFLFLLEKFHHAALWWFLIHFDMFKFIPAVRYILWSGWTEKFNRLDGVKVSRVT